MITLPLSPPPTKGGASPASSTTSSTSSDGTDVSLADLFATLVASMVNPQLLPVATPDAAPAAPSASKAVVAAQPGAGAATAVTADATKTEGADTVADPATAAPAAGATATAPTADDLAALINGASSGATPGAAATTAPIAGGPALSAATVINARRPAASEADKTETVEPANDSDQTATVGSAKPAPTRTAPADDDAEIDPNHLPVAHGNEGPSGIAEVTALHKTKDVAPTATVMPHQQVAATVSPLLRRGDGSYRLTLHLKPEHLGNVDLEVDLHHGTIDLHVSAEHDHARELLVEHLDELKAELEHTGLQTGSLDISSREQAQQQQQDNRRSGSNAFTAINLDATPDEPTAVATTPSADAAVDLQL